MNVSVSFFTFLDGKHYARGDKSRHRSALQHLSYSPLEKISRSLMSDSAALKLRSIVSKNDDENRFVRRPRNDVRSLGQSRLMSLTDVLASSGCHLFLEAMRKANRLQGANSITILAPNDDAFHSGISEAIRGLNNTDKKTSNTTVLIVYLLSADYIQHVARIIYMVFVLN